MFRNRFQTLFQSIMQLYLDGCIPQVYLLNRVISMSFLAADLVLQLELSQQCLRVGKNFASFLLLSQAHKLAVLEMGKITDFLYIYLFICRISIIKIYFESDFLYSSVLEYFDQSLFFCIRLPLWLGQIRKVGIK